MKTYIAYFDFLGFKSFILNNDTSEIGRRVNHILRDIEAALGQGNYKDTLYGVISDISQSKLNCLNISDTIILWTNDDSYHSFKELLKVSFDFNWRVTRYHFPVRGAIVFDDINLISHSQNTQGGGTYNVNSIFGKGLVNAHIKAENLNMAGCVIDKSILETINKFEGSTRLLDEFAVLYNVPYKKSLEINSEYILRLFINSKLNQEAFNNIKIAIENAFTGDNKGMSERAKEIFDNTITYLEIFKE